MNSAATSVIVGLQPATDTGDHPSPRTGLMHIVVAAVAVTAYRRFLPSA